MQIRDLRTDHTGDRVRVAATVKWEDCDRPDHEIYFETVEKFQDGLTCNPHAFLIGSAIPAMHFGEARVSIDAEICPELRYGLEVAMGWLRQWFYEPGRGRVRIEARTPTHLPNLKKPPRAGIFFSGGIDSFAALRSNRINFPLEHPWSMKDGLLVYGLEQDVPASFEYVRESLSHAAADAGITLIPVYTNLYLAYRQEDSKNRFSFWYREFMGAALAAVAHAFSSRLTLVTIASDYDIPNQRPHGSQPLLDPNYSSIDLRILHKGITLSRFSKTKLLADWAVALRHLRVCNQYRLYEPGRLNCCKCEKCLRTMLALVAVGVLDKTGAFRLNDVSAKDVRSLPALRWNTFPLYEELIAPLAERGRHDLAHAIEYKLAEYRKRQKIDNLKTKLKLMDSKYFNNALTNLKRSLSRRQVKYS